MQNQLPERVIEEYKRTGRDSNPAHNIFINQFLTNFFETVLNEILTDLIICWVMQIVADVVSGQRPQFKCAKLQYHKIGVNFSAEVNACVYEIPICMTNLLN